MALPDIFADQKPIDWRKFRSEPDPDDEELDVTPQDVIDLLGFDPKEFSDESKKTKDGWVTIKSKEGEGSATEGKGYRRVLLGPGGKIKGGDLPQEVQGETLGEGMKELSQEIRKEEEKPSSKNKEEKVFEKFPSFMLAFHYLVNNVEGSLEDYQKGKLGKYDGLPIYKLTNGKKVILKDVTTKPKLVEVPEEEKPEIESEIENKYPTFTGKISKVIKDINDWAKKNNAKEVPSPSDNSVFNLFNGKFVEIDVEFVGEGNKSMVAQFKPYYGEVYQPKPESKETRPPKPSDIVPTNPIESKKSEENQGPVPVLKGKSDFDEKKSELQKTSGHLDPYSTNYIDYLVKEGNFTSDEAKSIANVVSEWSDGYYASIRKGGYPEKSETLEKMIERMPKFNEPIYRGVKLPEEFLGNIKVGNIVSMGGVSSWSSDKSIAINFSSHGDDGKVSCVFLNESKSAKQGISIKHMSNFPSENEVLMSGKSSFKITKIRKKRTLGNKYALYVHVEEIY